MESNGIMGRIKRSPTYTSDTNSTYLEYNPINLNKEFRTLHDIPNSDAIKDDLVEDFDDDDLR